MISPKTTMPKVEAITAIVPPPPVSTSSRIVIVLFTLETKMNTQVVSDTYKNIAKQYGAEKEVAHGTDRHYCLEHKRMMSWTTREKLTVA